MKTWEAKVYIKNGNARIPHTVRIHADSSFSAKQQLQAQYGTENVVSIPTEVNSGSSYNPAPWINS